MLFMNEAPGVHRVEDALANWYLVEDGPDLLVVDTGQPASWRSLTEALHRLGRRPSDIRAVVLTHSHFDHIGFAARARRELGVDVLAHERELAGLSHPWRYKHERSRLPYLRHLHFDRVLLEMGRMGALWVKGVRDARPYPAGEVLDLPGRPRVVFTPGHTPGHCSLHLPDRGAVIVGDAFVMVDPYTGRGGPCLVAGAATADSALALASLDALAGLDAAVALTGHGVPWRGGMAQAVELARAAGLA